MSQELMVSWLFPVLLETKASNLIYGQILMLLYKIYFPTLIY